MALFDGPRRYLAYLEMVWQSWGRNFMNFSLTSYAGRPYLIRRPSHHWRLYVLCHKLLILPLPLPWGFTNHHVAELVRYICFLGFNLLWAWNNLDSILNYGLFGWLAVAKGALALLFGARNNLFATILRVPSSILLMYHRWTGLATLVHATVHFPEVSKPWLTTSALSYVIESQRN